MKLAAFIYIRSWISVAQPKAIVDALLTPNNLESEILIWLSAPVGIKKWPQQQCEREKVANKMKRE